MRIKRDRIFVIVLAIIIANLAFLLITTANELFDQKLWLSFGHWALIIADIIAIVGAFWLLQSYRRARKIAKEKEAREKEDSSSEKS